jgi:hypothetical protein
MTGGHREGLSHKQDCRLRHSAIAAGGSWGKSLGRFYILFVSRITRDLEEEEGLPLRHELGGGAVGVSLAAADGIDKRFDPAVWHTRQDATG